MQILDEWLDDCEAAYYIEVPADNLAARLIDANSGFTVRMPSTPTLVAIPSDIILGKLENKQAGSYGFRVSQNFPRTS